MTVGFSLCDTEDQDLSAEPSCETRKSAIDVNITLAHHLCPQVGEISRHEWNGTHLKLILASNLNKNEIS